MERGHTPSAERSNFALWVAVLAAPAAWAVQLQLVYALVPLACRESREALLHVPTAMLLAVAVAAAWFAIRNWRSDQLTQTHEDDPRFTRRRRLMATIGVLSSMLFSLIIVAQWIPTMFIDACTGWEP